MLKQMLFAATIGLLMNSSASAHVTLEQGEAPVGAAYKAVFRIAHGCNGKPTNVVRSADPRRGHRGQAHAKAGMDAGESNGSLCKGLLTLTEIASRKA